jgi:hypothetical protein
MSSRYAVAATLTKAIPTGLNIATRLAVVIANSEDEATGWLIKKAMAELIEHEVSVVVVTPILDEPPETILPPDRREEG